MISPLMNLMGSTFVKVNTTLSVSPWTHTNPSYIEFMHYDFFSNLQYLQYMVYCGFFITKSSTKAKYLSSSILNKGEGSKLIVLVWLIFSFHQNVPSGLLMFLYFLFQLWQQQANLYLYQKLKSCQGVNNKHINFFSCCIRKLYTISTRFLL